LRFWENHNPEKAILESEKERRKRLIFRFLPLFFWHSLPSVSEIFFGMASILSENHLSRLMIIQTFRKKDSGKGLLLV